MYIGGIFNVFWICMFVLFIAFLAPFWYAFANIIECKLSNNILKKPIVMVFYISLMNTLFLPLLLVFGAPELVSWDVLGFYFLLAVIDVLYLFPYYKALKEIDTSIVSSLFSLGQISIPVLTYFILDEKLRSVQYVGFSVIIGASVILSINDFRGFKINRAFYYMVLVSLLRAIYVVIEKYIFIKNDNWINMIIPFLFLLHKKTYKGIKKSFIEYKKNAKVFCINEFFCFLGMACFVFGLSKLSAVVSSAINATAPLFLLVISLALKKLYNIKLKETITPLSVFKKVICYALIIVGVIMVGIKA